MARQPHLYGALREDHKRALDALNTHIDQGKQLQQQAPQVEPARAGPELTTGDISGRSPGPNYSALREEHARSVEGLSTQIDQSRQGEQARQVGSGREGAEFATAGGGDGRPPQGPAVADKEPERPQRHYAARSTGWTDRGDMVSHQASADKMVRDHWERRQALSAHVDQQRTPGNHGGSPDRQGGREGPQTDGPQGGRKPDRGPDMER